MTLTAEAITLLGTAPCKAVADMSYYWGAEFGHPNPDTERWVVEYKCPDGFNVFMFWRTDNNGPILTHTTEPGLVVRIMDHTTIAKTLDDARRYKSPYAEPPP